MTSGEVVVSLAEALGVADLWVGGGVVEEVVFPAEVRVGDGSET